MRVVSLPLGEIDRRAVIVNGRPTNRLCNESLKLQFPRVHQCFENSQVPGPVLKVTVFVT